MGQATQTNTYSGGRADTINIWQRQESEDLSTVKSDGYYNFMIFPDKLIAIGDLIDVSGPDYVARLKITGKNTAGWLTSVIASG